MNKDNENRKLEIIVPLEAAERLYQVLTDLVVVLSQEDVDAVTTQNIEKRLFASFLKKKIKAEQVDAEEMIRVLKLTKEVRKLVVEDIEAALRKLESSLSVTSKINNEVVNLLSQHNRITKALNNGIIQFQIANHEYNRIVNALFLIVDNLDEDSLKDDVF